MSLQSSVSHHPPSIWRLLLTPPLDGPLNMAVDEALLDAVAEGRSPPTLRLFAWTPPCLSLGYAQPLSDVDMERLRAHGWDLVRRPTGGRAILHTDELTYSVIAPMDEPRVLGGVIESYRRLSAGLLRGLQILGLHVRAYKKTAAPNPSPSTSLPVCFEVPSDYEITANGRKLLGSAQVRKRGAVLQHGSLPLVGDIARICDALRFESEAERERVKARVRERATTAQAALGREVSWDEAARAIRTGFAEALKLEFLEAALSADEQAAAEKLRTEKYAAQEWNERSVTGKG
ncbi:MAG: lipoate--protein ligase family protein [Anaerolineales bacterium]|nr:lipoate--protein ligase family protein [Anaerolineales bacterium]